MLYKKVTMSEKFAESLKNANKALDGAKSTMSLCIMLVLGHDAATVKQWLCEVFGVSAYCIANIPAHVVQCVARGERLSACGGEWWSQYLDGTNRTDAFFRFAEKIVQLWQSNNCKLALPESYAQFKKILDEKWARLNDLYDSGTIQRLDGGQWENAILQGEKVKKGETPKFLESRKGNKPAPKVPDQDTGKIPIPTALQSACSIIIRMAQGMSESETADFAGQIEVFLKSYEDSMKATGKVKALQSGKQAAQNAKTQAKVDTAAARKASRLNKHGECATLADAGELANIA